MRRRSKNLLISDRVLEHAREYCFQFGATLSRVVEDYLALLPLPWDDQARRSPSPVVRALRGSTHQYDMEEDTYAQYVYGRWRESPPYEDERYR